MKGIAQTKYVFTVFALVALPAAISAQAPLPKALTEAQTASVVNGGVDQDVYDRLVLELQAWKRFTLVPDQGDITITLTSSNTIGTNGATGQPVRAIAYRLWFKQGDTVLYSDALKGCCSLKAMVRKTLEKLDKRMRARS
jgi:hypothetical protein